MKPLKYTMAALALIAAASFTSVAKAQTAGDLIFGAYDANTSSSTVANSFELDLGAFNSISSGETWNLGTTVSSEFSADSSASLLWSIAASPGTGAASGGLSGKEVAITAESLPTLPTQNTTEAQGIASEVANFSAGTTIVLPSSTSSTGKAIEAISDANANTGSFQSEFTTNGGGYGYGTGFSDTYPSTDSVTLYTILGGGATNHNPETANADGTFTLSNVSGNEILTYQTAAVPEPSAYALGLCAVALFWVLKRRNSVA